MAVEHIQASVAHWFADRDRAIVDRHNLVSRGECRGFGRAITVEQMLWGGVRQYPSNNGRVQHITADNQVAQARKGFAQPRGVLMEQSGGHPQYGYRLFQQQALEIQWREQVVLPDHHHTASIEQRCPDVQRTGVKRRVGGKRHTILSVEIGITVVDHQAADGTVRHQYTFRNTCRTRGVHDVGDTFAGLR